MADINKVNFDYIKKWEGGLSRNPRDSASKHTVPDGSGYHTNMGVTWATWKFHFGEDIKGFYAMPFDKWKQVYLWYWNLVGAARIPSQAIGEFLADWAWASGVNAPRQLQHYLYNLGYYKLVPDGRFGDKTLAALLAAIKEKGEAQVYEGLYDHRIEWLKKIPSYKDFGRGWVNRLEDFDKYAKRLLSER